MTTPLRLLVTAASAPAGRSVMMLLADDPRVMVRGIDASTGEVPRGDAPGYVEALDAIAKDFDWVIPCSDQEVLALARYKKSLQPPQWVVSKVMDKALMYRMLRDVVPVPEFIVGGWMKPRHGQGGDTGKMPEELVVCEYLPGREYSVDTLYWNNRRLVASVVRERVKVERGVSVEGRVTSGDIKREVNVALPLLRVDQIASSLRFRGPVNIQFKFSANGELVLTDINPRFGGGVTISARAGVNFPKLLVDMLVGDPIGNTVPKPGVYRTMLEGL